MNISLLKYKNKFISNIEVFNLYLLCFTFYEPTILPHYLFLLIKYVGLIYLFISNKNNIYKLGYLKYGIFIYGGINALASIVNLMSFNTIVASCFYGLQILVVFITVYKYIEDNSVLNLIINIFLFFGIYLLINDTLMLFINYEFWNPDEFYFIGNKFVVSYLHCFISVLYLYIIRNIKCDKFITVVNKKVSLKYFTSFILIIYTIIICKIVSCTTGILMSILLLLMAYIPKKYEKYYKYSIQMISILLILNFVLLGPFNILESQFVKDFMTNVLNKSSNLTGRTIIWNKILNIILDNPIIGYGYYNNIVEKVVSFGNAQNGILKLLVDTGIIGLFSYIYIIYYAFNENENDSYPFVVFMYSIILASLVEIPFNHMVVFMGMAIASFSSKKDAFIIRKKGEK